MSTAAETPLAAPPDTLAGMRAAAGLSLEEAGRRLGEAIGRGPYTHVRILQIEQRGTVNIDHITGLAQIYGRPFKDVLAAVQKSRRSM